MITMGKSCPAMEWEYYDMPLRFSAAKKKDGPKDR